MDRFVTMIQVWKCDSILDGNSDKSGYFDCTSKRQVACPRVYVNMSAANTFTVSLGIETSISRVLMVYIYSTEQDIMQHVDLKDNHIPVSEHPNNRYTPS